MDIEFNTNKISKPEPAQPVTRQDAVRRVEDDATFKNTEALENKLKDVPLIRSDKVAHASRLLTNVQYPPEEVLNSLATLLALNLK